MNYHHIYHAGNFADIFKHIILTLCLEKFHEKPTPFFVLDTHAGIGKYDLAEEKSVKTFEADEGIKKILAQKNFNFLPERYLKILAKINRCEISELPHKLKIYTGSPALIRDYLRQDDRAIFAELNRTDFLQLRKAFAGNPKFSLFNEDGFSLIKSKLPPLEKRGLIIIDPAFEKIESRISADYEKIISALTEGYKRFAHGVYLVWYPIIKSDKEILEKFYHEMSELKFSKIMHATFDIGTKKGETKMHACGMFIFNAPWQLDEKLNSILPQVLEVLQHGEGAGFAVKIIKKKNPPYITINKFFFKKKKGGVAENRRTIYTGLLNKLFLKMKNSKSTKAFSLIELSIVILIIGILIAGVTQASRLVSQMKLSTARSLTQNAPVASIKNLTLWIESTADASFPDSVEGDGNTFTAGTDNWFDINPQATTKSDFLTTAGTITYKANVINGLPAILFDGSAAYMTSSNMPNIVNAATIFVVLQSSSLAAGQVIFSKRTAASLASNTQMNIWTTGQIQYCDSKNTDNTASYCNQAGSSPTGAVVANTPIAISFVYNGGPSTYVSNSTSGGSNYFLNGAASTQTTTSLGPDTTVTASMLLGRTGKSSAGFFNGYLAELIIFDRALKKEERQSVEAYIGQKWGIKMTVAAY